MSEWIRTNPVARKEHRCEICARVIRKGETYLRGVGLDGTAWTWKECAHCEAMLTLYDIQWDDTYCRDTVDDWAPGSVAEWRVKANWSRMWTRRDGSLIEVPS
jgi:hypothetical protein